MDDPGVMAENMLKLGWSLSHVLQAVNNLEDRRRALQDMKEEWGPTSGCEQTMPCEGVR